LGLHLLVEQEMGREQFLTWPNRMTMLRIILIGPFVVALLNLQTWWWARYGALLIFALMAMSDALDGWLARRFRQETPLGRFLDPLADKLLITCAMILLGLESTTIPPYKIPSWVVVSALGKDLFVIVGFFLIFIVTGHVFIRVGWPGKLCTDFQMVLVLVVLLGPDLSRVGGFIHTLLWMLWIGSAAFAALTCWQYFRVGMRFVHVLSQREKEEPA
jgi:CDP-diacylglycerol--glycerol-3-phosphate 3-phosphatidyltransferase